ncbi:MAG TPA: acetate/propionate family kinase [Pseudomonadales bacterium]|nr:acetate/propionate family kinase [Pseudomonadales bacterium]
MAANTQKTETRASAGLSGEKFILTVNGGSSSIKFALFETGSLQRIFSGRIEGIGLSDASFTLKGPNKADNFSEKTTVPDYAAAVNVLMSRIGERISHDKLAAVGHRIVHGGPKYWQAQLVTRKMIAELHQMSPFDPEHLPGEILLIETIQRLFPKLRQFACFDTAFHHDLPRVAQLLPIPRRYNKRGVRRYGFHGLSCEFLIEELRRRAGAKAANGRVVLAHLGNGASITAARGGKSMDTSMSFTPTAGLVMSSRTGDLDPSLAWYLLQVEKVSAKEFHHMVNHESGLLGVSEISSDTRELMAREKKDIRAAEALALFCYQIKKYICAMAGALAGLDTLVFAGGIGENDSILRGRICDGLEFLGIVLDAERNGAGVDVISAKDSRVTVRVIRTDEELIIAKTVGGLLASK